VKTSSLQIREIIAEAVAFLELHHVPSPRLEADILLAHVLEFERVELYKNPDRPLTVEEHQQFFNLLKQRAEGVPSAYLRGKKEFFSRTFYVGPGVLIPRAETEQLVEAGLQVLQDTHCQGPPLDNVCPDILDLGTGSGAIIISLLLERPDAKGFAVERSLEALHYASKNSLTHGVTDRLHLIQGNLFDPVEPKTRFDLIVANPPYIPTDKIPSELKFEPQEAFDGGPDGLQYYRQILGKAWTYLKPNAFLILEIGIESLPGVGTIFSQYSDKYDGPLYQKDFAGIDRIVILKAKP